MALFRREVPVEIVFDEAKMQELRDEVAVLVATANAAVDKLRTENIRLENNLTELKKTVTRLERVRLRPVTPKP